MNRNINGTRSDDNSKSVSATARYLMSSQRQRVQYRQQVMLTRTAEEVGVNA